MEELEPEKVDFVFYFKSNRTLISMPIVDFEVKEEVHLVFEFMIDDFGNVLNIKFNWKVSSELCHLVFELEKYLDKVIFKPLCKYLEEHPEPILKYYTQNDYLIDDVEELLDKAHLIFVSFIDNSIY